MPVFQKKVLSAYIRNGCKRRLRLSLYPTDKSKRDNGMPETQKARAGVGLVGEMGYDWQEEKVSELADVFGASSVLQVLSGPKNRAQPQDLLPLIKAGLQPHQFIVEAKYTAYTDAFRQGMGLAELADENGEPLDLRFNHADLMQVLPARSASPAQPDEYPGYSQEVHPDGSLTPLDPTDTRLRLRVIDIKMAAAPGAHYFAEVVYYALTLAGWLHQEGLQDQLVVVAASAVWPGSYEASAVQTAANVLRRQGILPTLETLTAALEQDLEIAPFDTFVAWLRRFFAETLPEVLATPWQELPWHVDFRCSGCEFLGYPWPLRDGTLYYNELWCWPEAQRTGHASQVVGLSRGNRRQLGQPTITELAQLLPDNELFRSSPSLRMQRRRFPGRAASLLHDQVGSLPDTGSDALMPRWPDLHIYLFLDYDLASAVTVAFGIRAFWREPLPFGSALTPQPRRWDKASGATDVFLVDARKPLDRERAEFLAFLRAIWNILHEVRRADKDDADAGRRTETSGTIKRSTYQIFLWDEAQRRQLQRVASRHLPAILADTQLRDLAWLFPPPELLTNPDEASVRSPFTLVSRVVQNTVAVPLPHHYTLFGVAQRYHAAYVPPDIFTLYQDPLSDLVPAERIHELWTKKPGVWQNVGQGIERANRAKLEALNAVVTRLEADLQLLPNRLAAPVVGDRPARALSDAPPLSQLLYEFTRLNAALTDLAAYAVRAMPAYEREARFKSALLLERLTGPPREAALTQMGLDPAKAADLWVYTLGPDSRDLNVRPGDIGLALSPADRPDFLVQMPYLLAKPDYKVEGMGAMQPTIAESGLTGVSVQAIHRRLGYIVLRPDTATYLTRADDLAKGKARTPYTLESAGLVDLSRQVMLDPVEKDYLIGKVELTLRGIGFPELAFTRDNATIRQALNLPSATPPGIFQALVPAGQFLWDGAVLATIATGRNLSAARPPLEAVLQALERNLNPWQWQAWAQALSSRLSLIWGPPGTGKSQTLRVLIAGALLEAHQRRQPLRVLITANSYTAIDNVLLELPALLAQVLPGVFVDFVRLLSRSKETPRLPAGIRSLVPATTSATTDYTPEVQALRAELAAPNGLVVIAGPPQQVHNLATGTKNKTKPSKADRATLTQRRWFDLVLIDEASQLDVASATLVLSTAADEGAYVLAGDDLQLPPIHQADPPKGLEQHVGSVFEYARRVQQVPVQPLNTNYRSNATLVEFTRTAGYDPGLSAYSPNLRLNLADLPTTQPADWPATLAWSANWNYLLDPNHPATAFVHTDDTSGQANDFEADAVAAVVWLLRGHLRRQLLHELRPDGTETAATLAMPMPVDFWDRSVGIVTPHRAQMSRIVSRLQELFPTDDPEKIRAAVDTVERFQGQQRDVVIASFGIGDPDLIRSEDEFLYSLRRFNVLASRARAKLIVLASQSLIDHLPNDADVLEESRLLKRFVETFCQPVCRLELPYKEPSGVKQQQGQLHQR
jgi:DNA replication ATP-dependent helicase Dna2